MDILVAEIDPTEARRIAEVLRARNHRVRVVVDAPALTVHLTAQVPDVVVADTSFLAGRFGVTPTAMRAMRPDHYVYVIAVVARADGPQVEGLYRAGVDDFLRRGSCREEIVGRAEAPARIRSWSARLGMVSCDFGAQYDLERLKAWRELEALSGGEFGELLGNPLHGGRLTDVGGIDVAAEITVSLPAERIEIRFAVGLDAESTTAVSSLLFGGPVSPDVLADALREMANTLAGAFKRAALAEGALFTIGLPVTRPPFRLGAAGTRAWVLEDGHGANVAVMALQLLQEPQRVCARDLRQGMVLVQDVRNAGGMTLLTAGTALTERTVQRLIALVGPTTLIEVGDPGQTREPDAAAREVA